MLPKWRAAQDLRTEFRAAMSISVHANYIRVDFAAFEFTWSAASSSLLWIRSRTTLPVTDFRPSSCRRLLRKSFKSSSIAAPLLRAQLRRRLLRQTDLIRCTKQLQVGYRLLNVISHFIQTRMVICV